MLSGLFDPRSTIFDTGCLSTKIRAKTIVAWNRVDWSFSKLGLLLVVLGHQSVFSIQTCVNPQGCQVHNAEYDLASSLHQNTVLNHFSVDTGRLTWYFDHSSQKTIRCCGSDWLTNHWVVVGVHLAVELEVIRLNHCEVSQSNSIAKTVEATLRRTGLICTDEWGCERDVKIKGA